MTYDLLQMLVSVGLFWAILLGLPLGSLATAAVLARFRARVARSMRESARTDRVPATAGDGPQTASAMPPRDVGSERLLAVEFTRPDAVLAATAPRSGPAASAKRQGRRVAVVHGVAASIFVLINVIIFLRFISAHRPTEKVFLWYALFLASFFWAFASHCVLVVIYVLKRRVHYLATAVIALLAGIGLWDLLIFEGSLFHLWLWTSAAPTGVALLLAARRLRAVGPLAIVGVGVWSSVSMIVIFLGLIHGLEMAGIRFVRPDLQDLSLRTAVARYVAQLDSPAKWQTTLEALVTGPSEGRIYVVERPQREQAARIVAYATFLVAFIGGALAAWAVVTAMASASRRRRASDQMLTIDVMVLVFAIYLFSVQFDPGLGETGSGESGSIADRAWIAITTLCLVAFVAYKLASAAGLWFLRRARPPVPPRTLLLLRVFGFDRRTQGLLDDLGQRWRYLGPIRLIAGPDLAYATVEPHEFYDFLSGRLARAFIKDRNELESRLAQDASIAAPDGLFPVVDFFCHDDTWRMTVSRLARDADAIFMDLRGFTPANQGCIFEIEQLIAWVPIDRIVLLADATTDFPLLERTLADAWQRRPGDSPNTGLERPVIRVLKASKSHGRTLDALMVMLCAPFDRRESPLAVASPA